MAGEADRRTLKLTLAYDGGPFVGWQRQAEGRSIQGVLEEALSGIAGAPVSVIGAGRTDAGVHAAGQVASVRLGGRLDEETLARALNARLPPEVRVLAVERASPDFHARYSARAKTYRYWLAPDPVVSPFVHRYVWHLPGPLDTARMDQAASVLVGRHDFSAFQSAGSEVATTERTMAVSTVREVSAEVAPLAGAGGGTAVIASSGLSRLIVYEVTGDGFLRHMVRAITGTLVEVGRGRRQPEEMARLLVAGQREAAGPTAPATGLCLVRVDY